MMRISCSLALGWLLAAGTAGAQVAVPERMTAAAEAASMPPASPASDAGAAADAARPAATEAAPARLLESVSVVGLRDPARASYTTLLAGAAAFEVHRSLAPEAVLRFQVRPGVGLAPVDPAGLVLSLFSTEQSWPLRLDEDLAFRLPEPPSDLAADAEIRANRRAGSVRVLSLVNSPGLGRLQRRMGDLRLQCEVNWAIERVNMSFLVRGALNLTGGICRSSYIAVQFGHGGVPLREAVLAVGERRMVLPLSPDGRRYTPPVWDKRWPDDALVTLTPAEPG